MKVVPIAIDAFVFLVHSESPIKGLSFEQVRKIYSGEIVNWKDVDLSRDRPVNAYRRPKDSGSEELMQEIVMRDKAMSPIDRPNIVTQLMSHVYLAIAQDRYGIGYSIQYYEHYMAGSAGTRPIEIDGIYPDHDSIQARTYPFLCNVYGVVRVDPAAECKGSVLLDWLTSDEGQAVVEQIGYVPIRSLGKAK